MFRFSELVSNDMLSDEECNAYNLSEPAVIFGCADVDPDSVTISVRAGYDDSRAEMILGDYLSFLSGCKNVIREYLSERLSLELDDEWTDDLEIYEVSITVNDDDDYGATVSFGAVPVFGDSEIQLDFDRENIEDMR